MRPEETPVPIPNTTVKSRTAESTMLETVWEDRRAPEHGGVAQLGEHLPCKQGVKSSNLSISTVDGSSQACTLKTAYKIKYPIKTSKDVINHKTSEESYFQGFHMKTLK